MSPALEKPALIRVTGTVTSDPSEAVSEKGLKKHLQEGHSVLWGQMRCWMQRVEYFFPGNVALPESALC